ncbi:MAG TPA: glucokinase [Candidimonas sp.]|nr:glucokinase [Candidimonas sp.]
MSTGTLERPLNLVADIGGTRARFGLCTSVRDIGHVSAMEVKDFARIDLAIQHYLDLHGNPGVMHAVIGIANPITGDEVQMTNSPWHFSIEQTRRQFGFQSLRLINDFTALAMAVPYLSEGDLRTVGGGRAESGTPLGLVGPGTGLGVSGLIPTGGGKWHALAAEGGHVSFAACDTREQALWEDARRQFGHVSMERLVSGRGLQFIYRHLSREAGVPAQDYTPADITGRAIAGADLHCQTALDTFCAILGTAASNLALTLGARGGIYLGGGIVPRLGDYFDQSPFRERFNDKGRFTDYLAAIPVFVITSDYPALLGAAALLND